MVFASGSTDNKALQELRDGMNELNKTIKESNQKTGQHTKMIIFLTVMMLAIAIIQLVLFSATLPGFPEWARLAGTILVIVILFGFGYWAIKEVKKD